MNLKIDFGNPTEWCCRSGACCFLTILNDDCTCMQSVVVETRKVGLSLEDFVCLSSALRWWCSSVSRVLHFPTIIKQEISTASKNRVDASILAFVSLMIISSASSRFVSNNKVSSSGSFFNSLLLVHPQVNLLKQQRDKRRREREREKKKKKEPFLCVSLRSIGIVGACSLSLSLSLSFFCVDNSMASFVLMMERWEDFGWSAGAAALATMEDTLVALVLPVLVALDYVITLIMGCFHSEGVRTTPPGYEDPTVLAEETACMYVSPPHLFSLLSTHLPILFQMLLSVQSHSFCFLMNLV